MNCNLPKWPQMLVSGESVSPEQEEYSHDPKQ